METKRVQLDLSESEHAEMERLMAQSGLKTKREFVSNALTLFRWAAREVAGGSVIAAIPRNGNPMKQLEMPCLSAFTPLAEFFPSAPPDRDEVLARAGRAGRTAAEVLTDLTRQEFGHEPTASAGGAGGR